MAHFLGTLRYTLANLIYCTVSFSEFILRNPFVTFEDKIYESKRGIPTGNCISGQVADIAMHWLLFQTLEISKWSKYWNVTVSSLLETFH